MEQKDKIKISSSFIGQKTVLFIIMFFLLLVWSDYKRSHDGTFLGHATGFIIVLALLVFFFTRPNMYYDENNFYIAQARRKNIEIPLANIQSINYSILSFQKFSHSYRIKYLNDNNEIKSIRLFPGMSPISEFINCVKKENPNVTTKNWSYGFNELFD